MMQSPMYLSTVPPWRKTTSVISVRYSRSISATCSGSTFSEIDVNPRMSEKSTVTMRQRDRHEGPRDSQSGREPGGAQRRDRHPDETHRARNGADAIAADEGVDDVGVDLDPRHRAGGRERCGEHIVEDHAGRADEHDGVAEGLRPYLTPHDAVIRHPRERPRPPAKVDDDLVDRRSRRH